MTFVVVAVTSVIAVRVVVVVVVVASIMSTIRLKWVWFVMSWLLNE